MAAYGRRAGRPGPVDRGYRRRPSHRCHCHRRRPRHLTLPQPGPLRPYNGTAPIEVSSGQRKIYRLSRRANRRLNHAIHMAAVCQVSHRHSAGRAYFDKKIAEGKTPKRPCAPSSDASATPSSPASRPTPAGPPQPGLRAREGTRGTTLSPARPAHTPDTSSSAKPLPDPPPPYGPGQRPSGRRPPPAPQRPPQKHLTQRVVRSAWMSARCWSEGWPSRSGRSVALSRVGGSGRHPHLRRRRGVAAAGRRWALVAGPRGGLLPGGCGSTLGCSWPRSSADLSGTWLGPDEWGELPIAGGPGALSGASRRKRMSVEARTSGSRWPQRPARCRCRMPGQVQCRAGWGDRHRAPG